MILGFSTEIKGKPTYFVEKIHTGIRIENKVGLSEVNVPSNYNFVVKSKCKPKIHTIREDKNNRWEENIKIDFFINVRKKDMFRFAPVLPVVSTQSFELKYHENTFLVYVDEKLFFFGNRDFTINEFENYDGMLELVHNDGFDTIEDFCNYFNESYKGKIIHWTNFKY